MENKKRIWLLKNELKELEHKKDRIEELAIGGTLTKDRYQKKISEVEPEIKVKKRERLKTFKKTQLI